MAINSTDSDGGIFEAIYAVRDNAGEESSDSDCRDARETTDVQVGNEAQVNPNYPLTCYLTVCENIEGSETFLGQVRLLFKQKRINSTIKSYFSLLRRLSYDL